MYTVEISTTWLFNFENVLAHIKEIIKGKKKLIFN